MIILIGILFLLASNVCFAKERWWFKGSNGSWLYRGTEWSEYSGSSNEWATISVGAIYHSNAYWGKQMSRVFARPDAVKLTYPNCVPIVTDVKGALKDINGPGNTYDTLTITEAYPLAKTYEAEIKPLGYELAGYIWNSAPIALNIVANGLTADKTDHWAPASQPEHHRRVMLSDTGFIWGLDNVSLPLVDNYGYAIPHNQADRYAEWFNVGGFSSTFIYQTPNLNGQYKIRAWGQVIYRAIFDDVVLDLQSGYATVDYYINQN